MRITGEVCLKCRFQSYTWEISGSIGEGIHFNRLYRTSLCKTSFCAAIVVGIEASGGGNEAGEHFATGLLGHHRNTLLQQKKNSFLVSLSGH